MIFIFSTTNLCRISAPLGIQTDDPLESGYYRRLEKSRNNRILHHGHAPCYISLAVQQFLRDKLIPSISHQPHSSDLVQFYIRFRTKYLAQKSSFCVNRRNSKM
jgi:transposase InsO family protein